MATRCEIRPNKRGQWELDWGTLGLLYGRRAHAVSYAKDCIRSAEIVVFNEAGEIVEQFPASRSSNALNVW